MSGPLDGSRLVLVVIMIVVMVMIVIVVASAAAPYLFELLMALVGVGLFSPCFSTALRSFSSA